MGLGHWSSVFFVGSVWDLGEATTNCSKFLRSLYCSENMDSDDSKLSFMIKIVHFRLNDWRDVEQILPKALISCLDHEPLPTIDCFNYSSLSVNPSATRPYLKDFFFFDALVAQGRLALLMLKPVGKGAENIKFIYEIPAGNHGILSDSLHSSTTVLYIFHCCCRCPYIYSPFAELLTF